MMWMGWGTSLQLNSPSSLLFVNCKPVCNLFFMCFIIFAQLVVFKFSVICCAIIRHTCTNVQGPSRLFYWTTMYIHMVNEIHIYQYFNGNSEEIYMIKKKPYRIFDTCLWIFLSVSKIKRIPWWFVSSLLHISVCYLKI